MKHYFLISVLLLICVTSCRKNGISTTGSIVTSGTSKTILVDASKDGGVWWFPQSPATGFSVTNNHQGKGLADYLRNKGFVVDEIPQGTTITTNILSRYSNVIRAGGFGNYTQEEIAAYQSFLTRSSSLLLLQDHLTYFTNDQLSILLHVPFEGVESGTIGSFTPHPITVGVAPIPFIAGSFIRNPDPSQMTILGSITITTSGGNVVAGAMGILHHPTSRILFIGDMNGLEGIPQPFTLNLVNWLFR
jgi:hypothetical protein